MERAKGKGRGRRRKHLSTKEIYDQSRRRVLLHLLLWRVWRPKNWGEVDPMFALSRYIFAHWCTLLGLLYIFKTSVDSCILLATIKIAFKSILAVLISYINLFSPTATCPTGSINIPHGSGRLIDLTLCYKSII